MIPLVLPQVTTMVQKLLTRGFPKLYRQRLEEAESDNALVTQVHFFFFFSCPHTIHFFFFFGNNTRDTSIAAYGADTLMNMSYVGRHNLYRCIHGFAVKRCTKHRFFLLRILSSSCSEYTHAVVIVQHLANMRRVLLLSPASSETTVPTSGGRFVSR